MRAPLTGRLFDAAGEVMSPAFSRGARGGTYRYYVSTSLQRGKAHTAPTILRRVPAPAIEKLTTATLHRLLPHAADPLAHLTAVHLRPSGIDLVLPGKLRRALQDQLAPGDELHRTGSDCIVTVPIELPLRGGRRSVSSGLRDAASPDPVLIAALRRAHAMLERDSSGRPAIATAPASAYERRLLRLALLDPALQDDILAGRQPRGFRLETFLRSEIPLAWAAQRAALGWPVPPLA